MHVGVCINLLSMDSWGSVVTVLMWQETHSSWSYLNIEDSKAASTWLCHGFRAFNKYLNLVNQGITIWFCIFFLLFWGSPCVLIILLEKLFVIFLTFVVFPNLVILGRMGINFVMEIVRLLMKFWICNIISHLLSIDFRLLGLLSFTIVIFFQFIHFQINIYDVKL
jgi:hypothetical protein